MGWFKWVMFGIFAILLVYTVWHFHLGLKVITGRKKRYLFAMSVIIIACCLTIIIGPFLPAGSFRRLLIQFSNYYLGFWIYLVFSFLLLDIYRLIRKFLFRKNDFAFHGSVFVIIFILSAGMTIYGGIHAQDIQVHTHDVTVHKEAGKLHNMKVVLVSDWHLGYSIGTRQMRSMVRKINEQDADLVLIAGDIYDNQYDSIDDPSQISKILSGIKSRYGVYGVYGNHDVTEELVGGFTVSTDRNPLRDVRIEKMLSDAGITMLKDQVVTVAGKIQLIGRLDGEKTGNRIDKRDSLEELIQKVDTSLPVFVLNHEPEDLNQYNRNSVDLILSGHTHAGQFFPLTITRSFVWDNYWGIETEGDTTGAVTSGIGVYGPPLRVLSDSEVMVLNIKFQKP